MLEFNYLNPSVKESLLVAMLGSPRDAIITVNAQQAIVLFNPEAETMFGWQRHDVLQQPLEKLIPERFHPVHVGPLQAASVASPASSHSMKNLQSVTHGLRADGKEFPTAVTVSEVDSPDGKLFTAIVRDLTEHQALHMQLQLLESIFSQFDLMMVITEAEPFGEQGRRIVFVNPAFELHTGYSRSEVQGRDPRFMQGALTQRPERDRIDAALRKWRPLHAEVINYTKSGEAYWVELDIVPIANSKGCFTHWVSVQRDITQRKHAELALVVVAQENARLLKEVNRLNTGLEKKVAERTLALARQEALFRTLADQAPQVIWTLDPSGDVTYLNKAWFDLVGGSLQDWTGRQWFAAMHPEDLPDVTANWLLAQASQRAFSGVRRLLGKDHRLHTMAYRTSPVFDNKGAVAFWVGIDADVTEFKLVETALRQVNQELKHSEQALRELSSHQMAVKEVERQRIAQEIHDELGQRLTVLRMEVAMLPHAAQANPALLLPAGVALVKNQIDDILAVVRDLAGKLRPAAIDLGLSLAAEGLVENFQASLGIPCHLSDQLPAGLVLDDSRAMGVFRILQESLTNVARHAQARRIDITLAMLGDDLLLRVHDDGQGFDALPERARPNFGLSGMRERATALGGYAHVTSQRGHGTAVEARIPLHVPLQPAIVIPAGYDPLALLPLP